MTLVGDRVHRVGIARVEVDLGDPGALVDVEDAGPGLAPVARLVEPALAAGGPQRSLRRDVDHVRVARIDDDPAEVLGALEPHVRPGLPTVGGLVAPAAVADAALTVVLAAPHPHRERMLRI